MIFDEIDQQIHAMKQLRRREQIRDHQEQQGKADAKYSALVEQVSQLSEAACLAERILAFPLSEELRSKLGTRAASLLEMARNDAVEKDAVAQEDEKFKAIQTAVKRDWAKHFKSYTAATWNTLHVIREIDAEKMDACIEDIAAARDWTVERPVLLKLKSAKERAEELIQELGMDQEVETFLTKMTAGKATLADLSTDVLDWIQKEKLAGKIRLSFSGAQDRIG